MAHTNFYCFFILSGFFLFTVNSKYFFNSWCCILDYFILNCKLWDKFLIPMIIFISIISYIQIFYRNFELIFEFMALKRAPICGRNVCLSFFFCVFLYLIVIILIEKKIKRNWPCAKITRNEQKFDEFWVNIITDMIKHVTIKLFILLNGFFPYLNI